MAVLIRETSPNEIETILTVEQAAFGPADKSISVLVKELFKDPTAEPIISLLAVDGETAVGHIMFTRARLDSDAAARISILAPLAVISERQKQGIGGQLIRAGLTRLETIGGELVFVLGHIDYYPRHGFTPALPRGFKPPYNIPAKTADAWMLQELAPNAAKKYNGTVLCAASMDQEKYWRE